MTSSETMSFQQWSSKSLAMGFVQKTGLCHRWCDVVKRTIFWLRRKATVLWFCITTCVLAFPRLENVFHLLKQLHCLFQNVCGIVFGTALADNAHGVSGLGYLTRSFLVRTDWK